MRCSDTITTVATLAFAACNGSSQQQPEQHQPPSVGPACTVFPGPLAAPCPSALAMGDLNGDGRPDVIGGSPYLGTFLGNGDGTFALGDILYNTWTGPIAIADLDGDGSPEIISVKPRDDSSGLLLAIAHAATPDTLIDGPAITSLPVPFPYELALTLAAGDFDGDHHLDIALGGYIATADPEANYSTLRIYAGNGDGTLQAERIVDEDDELGQLRWSGVLAADLDHDGRADLVGLPGFDGTGAVYLGGVGPPIPAQIGSFGTQLVDINGDGELDAVGGGMVALGHGNGTFATPLIDSRLNGSLAIGNLDGDGKPDVAGIYEETSTVAIMRGNGDGTFQSELDYQVSNISGTGGIAIADFDRDGKADLFAGSSILLGRGDGTFDGWRSYTVGFDQFRDSLRAVTSADVNGDGLPDVVVAISDRVRVLFGAGGGALALGLDLPAPGATSVAVGDVDGDGLPDLVAFAGDVTTWRNLGGGAFDAPVTSLAQGDVAAAADLDGDGRIDVVTVDDTQINLLHGTGDGTFVRYAHETYDSCGESARTAGTPPPPQSSPPVLAVGDLDGDGRPDVVVSDCKGTTVWHNTGGDIVAGATVGPSSALAIADFDGDGLPDLALMADGSLGIAFGTGNGELGTAQPITTSPASSGFAVGDVDGDGLADLGFLTNGSLEVWSGRDGIHEVVSYALPLASTSAAALVDLDGDGKAEPLAMSSVYLDVLRNGCQLTAKPDTCAMATDCAGVDTDCAKRTCEAAACGWSYTAAGTAVTEQTAGDCKLAVCDGVGGRTTQPDDADTPPPTGYACQTTGCSGGQITGGFVPDGTPCDTAPSVCFEGSCAPPTLEFDVESINDPTAFADVRLLDVDQVELARCHASRNAPCVLPVTPGSSYWLEESSPMSEYELSFPAPPPTTTDSFCTFTAGYRNYAGWVNDAGADQFAQVFAGDVVGERFVAAAFDSVNALYLGSAQRLVKVDATSAVVWALAMQVDAIVIGPGDAIYATSNGNLVKLDVAGNVQWQRPAAVCPENDGFAHCLAVAPNGDVVFGGPQLMRWGPDGTLRYSLPPRATWTFNSVAIDSTDVTYLAQVDTGGDGIGAARFAADGTSLGDVQNGAALGGLHGSITVDSIDHLVVMSGANNDARINAYASDGSLAASYDVGSVFMPLAPAGPIGIVSFPDGGVAAAFALSDTSGVSGAYWINGWSSTLTLDSVGSLVGGEDMGLAGPTGVRVYGIAQRGPSYVAVVGSYDSIAGQSFGFAGVTVAAP